MQLNVRLVPIYMVSGALCRQLEDATYSTEAPTLTLNYMFHKTIQLGVINFPWFQDYEKNLISKVWDLAVFLSRITAIPDCSCDMSFNPPGKCVLFKRLSQTVLLKMLSQTVLNRLSQTVLLKMLSQTCSFLSDSDFIFRVYIPVPHSNKKGNATKLA